MSKTSQNITITNEIICLFYKKNPNVNIETVNLLVIELLEILMYDKNNSFQLQNQLLLNINENIKNIENLNSSVCDIKNKCRDGPETTTSHFIRDNQQGNQLVTQQKIISGLSEILLFMKQNNPPVCGGGGYITAQYSSHPPKNNIFHILNKIYSTSEISVIHQPTIMFSKVHLADNMGGGGIGNEETVKSQLFSVKRPNKFNILIENKDTERNVNNDEIRNFIQLMEENNCHGVFLSQNSGFSSKSNYYVETYNKLIIVYVHNVGYNEDKIRSAIDIIDNIALKFREMGFNSEGSIFEISINKEIMEEINKEYQMFISQKEKLINVFKESQKRVLNQMEELKFPELDKFLSTKFSIPTTKHGFKCDLCKKFNANNLKALAAHKRGCNRKNNGLCSVGGASKLSLSVDASVINDTAQTAGALSSSPLPKIHYGGNKMKMGTENNGQCSPFSLPTVTASPNG